jgi:hypothetical protein
MFEVAIYFYQNKESVSKIRSTVLSHVEREREIEREGKGGRGRGTWRKATFLQHFVSTEFTLVCVPDCTHSS